jgi:hypothetical protein
MAFGAGRGHGRKASLEVGSDLGAEKVLCKRLELARHFDSREVARVERKDIELRLRCPISAMAGQAEAQRHRASAPLAMYVAPILRELHLIPNRVALPRSYCRCCDFGADRVRRTCVDARASSCRSRESASRSRSRPCGASFATYAAWCALSSVHAEDSCPECAVSGCRTLTRALRVVRLSQAGHEKCFASNNEPHSTTCGLGTLPRRSRSVLRQRALVP